MIRTQSLMETAEVKITEPIVVLIKESCKPSYQDNELNYIITVKQCPNKKEYRTLNPCKNRWLVDITLNLCKCGYKLMAKREDLLETPMSIGSAYSIPKVELKENYTIEELTKYKIRFVRVIIPPTNIKKIKDMEE